MPRSTTNQYRADAIARLRATGMSDTAIAATLGISRALLRKLAGERWEWSRRTADAPTTALDSRSAPPGLRRTHDGRYAPEKPTQRRGRILGVITV